MELIMSAILSATIRVKNQAKLKEYISQVPATMAPHGAKMLGRGKVVKVLNGDVEYQISAFFSFPDADAIETWYNSDAYQALVSIREEGADMNIVILESF